MNYSQIVAAEFKMGDKVLTKHGDGPRTIIARDGDILWVRSERGGNGHAFAADCTPYTPPPVRTRWIVETERRVPYPDYQQWIEPRTDGGWFFTYGISVHEHDVIVAVTRQDGAT